MGPVPAPGSVPDDVSLEQLEEGLRMTDAAAERRRRRNRVVLVALILLLLAALAVGAYLLWQRADSGNGVAGVPGLQPGVPKIVSVSQLEDLADEQGPIYWAGPRNGSRYEVTVTTQGGTYVRYLPRGVSAGSKNRYLTVGTYGAIDGYDALVAANKRDADVNTSQTGAVIVTFHSAPDSTYFSFPKAAFQVEVFSPVAGQSRLLTESGDIRLIPDH